MSDTFKLPSGREFDANCGIVGLNDELDVFEGYDGQLIFDGEFDYEGLEDLRPVSTDWSPIEKVELADMMIKRWSDYRDKWVRDHAS